MKKLYFATLIAVLFAGLAFDAEAGRCRSRRRCGLPFFNCNEPCAAPAKQECCEEQTHVVCEKPICEKVITQKVCAEPICKIQKIKTYECPPGYTQVGSEEVVETVN